MTTNQDHELKHQQAGEIELPNDLEHEQFQRAFNESPETESDIEDVNGDPPRNSFFKKLVRGVGTPLVLCGTLAITWLVARNTETAAPFTNSTERKLTRIWEVIRSADSQPSNEFNSSPSSSLGNSSNSTSGMYTSVETMVVSRSNNQLSRTFTGTLKATQTSDLGFKRTGTIRKAFVDQGDSVKRGDVLIELDIKQLKADVAVLVAQRNVEQAKLQELIAGPRKQEIEAARAVLQELEALRDQAQLNADRQQRLLQDNAAARQDVDDSRKQYEASQNRVASQRQMLEKLEAGTRSERLDAQRALLQQLDANIESVQVGITESQLVAPFDGIVSARRVDSGAIVLPGATVIRLVESNSPEAWIGLPTSITADLSHDASYVLKTGSQTLMGKLKAVLPELDPMTRTQTAIFALEPVNESSTWSKSAPTLAFGQIVRLEMPVSSRDGIWIPRTSLTQSTEGTWAVFKVEPVGDESVESHRWIAKRVAVEVDRVDSERVFVRGLQAGKIIVAKGVHRLTPGQNVRPSQTAAALPEPN